MFILAVPVVFILRLISPWILVRWEALFSSRIGHFAANTELYLCERDAGINAPKGKQRHIDLFFLSKPICNEHLAKMWKRVLRIWPAWILAPIAQANRRIPGGLAHEIGRNTQHDRDVHNLLDRYPSHLDFTADEVESGEAGLRAMEIPIGAPFICLIVRDSAYLDAHLRGEDYNYHNFRDSDVQSYVLAAEELANRCYFVIRMGVKVNEAIKSCHKMVIDYATNGMRSDFMDIYLGAKCKFCISVGTGFDGVPLIFRRPIAYVNMVPLGYLFTFRPDFLGITKHCFLMRENRNMTLKEIFAEGVGFFSRASEYKSKGVRLIENTQEEIRDLVVEMAERLNGTWQAREDDEALQKRFWELFPTDAVDAYQRRPLHGEIRARFGAAFLRNNRGWLQ